MVKVTRTKDGYRTTNPDGSTYFMTNEEVQKPFDRVNELLDEIESALAPDKKHLAETLLQAFQECQWTEAYVTSLAEDEDGDRNGDTV